MYKSQIDELVVVAKQIGSGVIPEYSHNETFTVGAFDTLLIGKRGCEAFDLLVEVCNEYESLKHNSHHVRGFFHLLDVIVPNTNTTELPDMLKTIIFHHPEHSQYLRSWYRL